MKKILKTILLCAVFLLCVSGAALTTQAASAPSEVKLEGVETLGEKSVRINWKPVSDCDGYNIYRGLPGKAFKKIASVKGSGISSYTNKKLKKNTTYVYTVKAYKGSKEGKFDKTGLKARTAVSVSPSTKPYKKQHMDKNYYNSSSNAYWMLCSYLESFEGLDSSMLILKKGTYNIHGSLWVTSNAKIVLKNGVKINKVEKLGGRTASVKSNLFIFMDQSRSGKKNAVKGYKGIHNASITGEGNASINLNLNNAVAFTAFHCSNIKISGINIKDNKEGSKGFFISGSSNVDISNCKVTGKTTSGTKGVWIDLPASKASKDFSWAKNDDTVCKNVNITDCTFKKLDNAVYSKRFMKNKYQTAITIDKCKFNDITGDAIRIFNWKDPVISNSSFEMIGKGAICNSGPTVAIRMYGANSPVVRGNNFNNVERIVHASITENPSTVKGQGKTVNSISAAQYKIMTDENTVGSLGEYYVTEFDGTGTSNTRYWIKDDTRDYIMTADQSAPYRNINMLNADYNDEKKQYFIMRGYLEQIERNGGGTLTLKSGTYKFADRIFIPSNTTIILEDGVNIECTYKTITGPMFALANRADINNNVKYSEHEGVHDVAVIGPEEGTATINKNFITGTTLTMAHAKNVTIKNVTFVNIINTAHFIEVDACKSVEISGCTFKGTSGYKINKGAINIDTPDESTGGFHASYTSYDCTPNEDVMITGNVFREVSNAVESHNFSQDRPHKNIVISNNDVESYYYAFRAVNWDAPQITDNEIRITSNESNMGILLQGIWNPVVRGNNVTWDAEEAASGKFFMRVAKNYTDADNADKTITGYLTDEQVEDFKENYFSYADGSGRNVNDSNFGAYVNIPGIYGKVHLNCAVNEPVTLQSQEDKPSEDPEEIELDSQEGSTDEETHVESFSDTEMYLPELQLTA